ncbi:dynein light intermediate chain-domain-containing protein [Cantharellus anzutake]|uniref:dynein light intermediate chain-domain-containing protein n=1 Tax=Cantharellus anzutake TaxID=1750568 RepID=UPI0019072BB5|nr:dynein light intermediate chain-domain-containing protein [Cantharellus anzutake]KAF8339042.1 dynein light intermediate chain-domain-containing protein [Cantharellus anzutake]
MEQQSRPSSPEQNLWSSILNSVSSSRSIPSGNVVVLGEPGTGKSTLINAILQKPASVVHNDGDWGGKSDFALGYEWANVKDEKDEDTLARLSVYSVPSCAHAYVSLLPRFLSPRTSLPHTLVLITIDWTRPWTFIQQLEAWFNWIEQWLDKDTSREMKIAKEEGRERLQSHLQHYTEPSASISGVEPVSIGAAALNATLLPLGQGTLIHNSSGIPIVVVCSKADLIDNDDTGLAGLKGRGGDWEERSDTVMQVLRTICLKYGAALFYTSQQPATLAALRQYILHFLFIPPSPPAGSPPLKYSFAFSQRPNTLDRDRILVPAGWDSWGKIAVLREGFDATRWGEAWERDMESGEAVPGGARELFASLIGEDEGAKEQMLPPLIVTQPEQTFLAQHYESLSKDRDPRQQFRQPAASDPSAQGYSAGAGVVGPMGSSILALPSVEKVMKELEGEDASSRLLRATGAASRRVSLGPSLKDNRPPAIPTVPNLALPSLSASVRSSAPSSAGPGSVPPSATGDGRSQNEVLQNFFQSLLTNRASGSGPSPRAPATALPSANGSSPGVNGNTTS